MAKVRKLATML